MAEKAVTICTGVTEISCPIARESWDKADQSIRVPYAARVLPWQVDQRFLTEPENA